MKETETFECKESLTQLKRAVISIVAILNKHQRGSIVFGMKDDGTAVGVSLGKTTLREVAKTISEHIEPKVYPLIREVVRESKTCLLVEFEGYHKPYFAYGRAYIRLADENRILSKVELEDMFRQNKYHYWDQEVSDDCSLHDLSNDKIKHYVRKAKLHFTSKTDVLEKLELIRAGKPTHASLLLFGKNPSSYFPFLILRCATFMGTDAGSELLDMKDYKGDLFTLVEQAQKYVLQHINIGMRLEGLRRVDIPEINAEAIREAIINAFCHRDYTIPHEINVAVFKNRVEISNPGGLFGDITIKDILSKKISRRRNPLIADVLHRVHLVEKWGRGVHKIRALEPATKFEIIAGFFSVTFKRRITPQETTQETTQETSRKILEFIKVQPAITRKELAHKIGITEDGIKYHLTKLRNEKKIRHVGSTKKGQWEVLE